VNSQNYTQWMSIALEEAQKSLPQDIPVGCVIFQNGNSDIIGRGHNTREKCHHPSGHAEMMALEQAAKHLGRWRLEDCTAVVTLEPCPMCAAALLQSRIGTIVFGAHSPQEGALGSRITLSTIYSHKTNIIGGVLEEDARRLITTLFEAQRCQPE
jgi:tRNA(adenine34) deaminase